MTSLYATIVPHFTQDLLTPELKVGYHDEGGSWPFVAASLSQRLPLRCIEWKNLVGATKFIDKLPLSFVAQSELELDSAALPLVCLYLVKCEDMDHYRASVKARLGAWVERMNAAKVEWMVLYVPLGTRAKGRGASSSTSVYKKIFDKIRADFAHKRPSLSAAGIMLGAGANLTGASSNSSSSMGGSSGSSSNSSSSSVFSASERICKIEIFEGNSIAGGGAPGQHQQHESQWSELLLRLRHCIMDAFQVKCYQYEEEVRVLDAKRNANAASWDFGAFFLAKERLALMYQQTYLLDDAIRHLDELDAIFSNLSASEKRSFQDESKLSFQADDAIFTTAPLAVDLPATQQLIAKNRASTFVIQLHCFCRQMRTLYLMGSFPQLLQRATAFIASFFESLKQLSLFSHASGIKRHQPYQWAVAACLEVAYACELSWNGHDYQVSSASVPSQVTQAISPELMARNLGDILYLARRMLTAFARSLGAKAGTSAGAGDAQVDTDVNTVVSESFSSAWYEWLETLFASRQLGEHYERCVWEMSHLASLHFSRAGRHRFAVFLGGECARYHFRHREFESASRLFRSHARQCEEDKWWNLVGDCVRRICSSELELGRAAEAVAACFSMLAGITQEARAEIGRDYLEKMMHTLVQSLDQKKDAASAKLRMGELIKPSAVEVETMQTAGSDLDYGDVRVKLCVTNCFPAGIHIEKLRVRFSRQPATSRSGRYDSGELRATSPKERSSSITSTLSELPRLHSLVLEDESSSAAGIEASDAEESMGMVAISTSELGANPNKAARKELVTANDTLGDSELVDIDITTVSDDDELQLAIENAEANDESELILQEGNVFLHEKASVDLVFLHSDLGVGNYVCSGIDCVLAGNIFSLLTPSELEKVAAFEIPRRESTLRIAIDGPPLLTPQSTEQIRITVQAQNDTVADGVLEITCPMPGDSLEDEPGLLQFLEAEVEPSSTTTAFKVQAKTENLGGSDRLIRSIPAMSPGETRVYNVWLRVGESVDLKVDTVSFTTVSASLRYQHVTQTDTCVALRRTEAVFQVLRPLTERIRLKRVDSRIFAAISLTCNAECGLLLRDYRLEVNSHSSAAKLPLSSNNVGSLTVLQDPNARLCNLRLRPGETVHLAFVLQCESDANLPKEARLALDLEYDATLSTTGDADDVVQQQQQGAASQCWPSTFVVRIPLDEMRGAYYRVDVEPKLKSKSQEALYEFAAGEEIIFHILVREFHPKRVATDAQGQQQPEAEETQNEEKLDPVLCLDESSERDWILLGKQHERFQFQLPSGDESNKSSNSIVDSHVTRVFATQKRFISTRVGRLRFPNFHLRVHGSSQQQQQERIPSERVLYPQSTMQVIVT